METVAVIATGMGLAWASGVNLYATVAVLGILGSTGHIALPEELSVLTNEGVIAVAALMYCVEFVADKTPGVDTGWDAIHTFIRIPAGAIIAAQAVAPVSEEAQLIAFLLGGITSATAHGVKMSSRMAINTSPEPLSNWTASVGEDFAALGALYLAFNHPYVMLAFLAFFFLFALWIMPKLLRLLRRLFDKLAHLFHSVEEVPPPPPPTA